MNIRDITTWVFIFRLYSYYILGVPYSYLISPQSLSRSPVTPLKGALNPRLNNSLYELQGQNIVKNTAQRISYMALYPL